MTRDLLSEMLFLMLWEVKLFVTGQDKASKDTCFLIHLIFQRNLGLKVEKFHTGEGEVRKAVISVTYYLNGPLHSRQ